MVGQVQEGILNLQTHTQCVGRRGGEGMVHHRLSLTIRQGVKASSTTAALRSPMQQPQATLLTEPQESRPPRVDHLVHRATGRVVRQVGAPRRHTGVEVAYKDHRLLCTGNVCQHRAEGVQRLLLLGKLGCRGQNCPPGGTQGRQVSHHQVKAQGPPLEVGGQTLGYMPPADNSHRVVD